MMSLHGVLEQGMTSMLVSGVILTFYLKHRSLQSNGECCLDPAIQVIFGFVAIKNVEAMEG